MSPRNPQTALRQGYYTIRQVMSRIGTPDMCEAREVLTKAGIFPRQVAGRNVYTLDDKTLRGLRSAR